MQLLWLAILILALVPLAIGFYSLQRRHRCRRFYQTAIELGRQGKRAEATASLLQAEANWSWNLTNGSRRSHLRDLELLAGIIDEVSDSSPASDRRAACRKMSNAIAELNQLFSDRSRFGLDGRSMKPEAASRWVSLKAELDSARDEFKLACLESKP
jgi:hypothetical protein